MYVERLDEIAVRGMEKCSKSTTLSSYISMPKHGYYTTFSKEVSDVSQQLLFNRSDDLPYTTTYGTQCISKKPYNDTISEI
ncbi:hypothetical protein AVEN_134868-1 [Araneus ventricosus]|uniref:Uncharacterized protein n=1 Tax=Araneus ventricosus TaxID=182803 RepID=A0A4Y2A9I0_ARAVE|nr:hypothetical protein AVEN_134868-1 [Araneus ventricosus]